MRISKAVDLALLRQQIIAAGQADPGALGTTGIGADGKYEVIKYANGGTAASLPSATDAVITAHDASTGAAAIQTAADAAALAALQTQYANMKSGLTTIRTHMAAINAGPAAPTATQTGTALKTLASDVTTLCNGLDNALDTLAAILHRAGVVG